MRFFDDNSSEALPEISVLMTVYNGAAYLQEAIASVFAQQTGAGWELIVVDDGSTDESADLVRKVSDPRVRLFQHAAGRNRGISASRNLALHHARAPLAAFLDCDDVLLPHHLQTQIDLLHRHPRAAMVYASAERWVHHDLPFDRDAAERAWWGSNYLPPLVPPGCATGLLQPGTLLRWMLADESVAPCMCTVVVRTAAARAVGGFENQFHGLFDDQVFLSKLCARFPVYAHPECLARYRQHSSSCCATASADPALRRAQTERFVAWLRQTAPHAQSSRARQARAKQPALA